MEAWLVNICETGGGGEGIYKKFWFHSEKEAILFCDYIKSLEHTPFYPFVIGKPKFKQFPYQIYKDGELKYRDFNK